MFYLSCFPSAKLDRLKEERFHNSQPPARRLFPFTKLRTKAEVRRCLGHKPFPSIFIILTNSRFGCLGKKILQLKNLSKRNFLIKKRQQITRRLDVGVSETFFSKVFAEEKNNKHSLSTLLALLYHQD